MLFKYATTRYSLQQLSVQYQLPTPLTCECMFFQSFIHSELVARKTACSCLGKKPAIKAMSAALLVIHDGTLFTMCNKDYLCSTPGSYQAVHAHAHAHASFMSTTTKPLPDLATNTDYDTLTMTDSLLQCMSVCILF
jgi:hypothetical protein